MIPTASDPAPESDSRNRPDARPEQPWSPRSSEPIVLGLLAVVLALQLWSWWGTEGYPIADSVEFMERARVFERGERMIDSTAIRPFGFSTLLVPFFALADWIGLPDQRAVVWSTCLLQMLLGLALVVVAMRLGARLGGRRGGLMAGVLVGANPVFLQYSSQPVPGFAAGICAGIALEAVLDRGDFKRGRRAGLWLGAAFLMAYQSLLIAMAVALLVLLRDGWRRRSMLKGILFGVACGILAQVFIDWAVHGTPGASLANHLVQNVGGVLASFFMRIGLRPIGEPIYKAMLALQKREAVLPDEVVLRALQSPWFYVVNLPRMLVWPAIAGLVLGLVRGSTRPTWKVWLPALTVFLNVLAMSHKGSKDFRLWLPLLPLLGALCAYGWTWIAPRSRAWRLLVDAPFAVLVVVLGVATLAPLGARRFGNYWRAMDWVDARAREIQRGRASAEPAMPRRVRVASAYNWAVYLRETAEVELVKLPWQLNLWTRYPPERRAEDFADLEGLDLFITHTPVLTGNPDLLEFVAARFEVAAAVHDQTIDLEGLGPILVLERRSGRQGEKLLFEMRTDVPPKPRPCPWPPAYFVGTGPEGKVERLVLLDWRYQQLPPQELGWITYRWTTPTGLSRDYTLLDRITSPGGSGAWQNDHCPGPVWGLHPTSSWKPGEVVSESYLVVPAEEPFRPGGPFKPIGGAYRRGDFIPASLWMAVVEFDPEALAHGSAIERARLSPARPGEDAPMVPGGGASPLETPDGFRFSADRLVRVGEFLLPVIPAARLRGDARATRE